MSWCPPANFREISSRMDPVCDFCLVIVFMLWWSNILCHLSSICMSVCCAFCLIVGSALDALDALFQTSTACPPRRSDRTRIGSRRQMRIQMRRVREALARFIRLSCSSECVCLSARYFVHLLSFCFEHLSQAVECDILCEHAFCSAFILGSNQFLVNFSLPL